MGYYLQLFLKRAILILIGAKDIMVENGDFSAY